MTTLAGAAGERTEGRPDGRPSGPLAVADRGGTRVALIGLLLPLAILVLWQVGAGTGLLRTAITSTPTAVAATLADLVATGVLAEELVSTVGRLLFGFGAGLTLGLTLGTMTGWFRIADRAVDPTIRALNAVPAVGWIPFLILSLGLGDTSKMALIAIATFFPVYVNTHAGIRGTDQKLIELATAYRLPRHVVVLRVVLPSALPQILVGVRLAVAISWVVATVSEILYGNDGLGVLLNDGRSLARPDQMVAVMIVLAILGKASDAAVARLQRRLTAWQSTLEGMPPHRARLVAARGTGR